MAARVVARRTVKQILRTYRERGGGAYTLGEAVTQREHAFQTATWLHKRGADREVVLAGFLHDVGHLVAEDSMDGLGCAHHEALGAAWLARQGFGRRVTNLVRHHVNAKRYLVMRSGMGWLSPASAETLTKWQGGPMTPQEASEWCHRMGDDLVDVLALRKADDNGKDVAPTACLPESVITTMMLHELEAQYPTWHQVPWLTTP